MNRKAKYKRLEKKAREDAWETLILTIFIIVILTFIGSLIYVKWMGYV